MSSGESPRVRGCEQAVASACRNGEGVNLVVMSEEWDLEQEVEVAMGE